MSRVEAAARAVAKDEDASNWDEETSWYQNGWLGRVDTILAAADQIMFSEAAIERAAKGIFDIRDDAYDMDEWEDLDSTDREIYLCQARAVVAALREET